MENMELWNKVKTPPKDALKQIKGGRLSGMTDISPQWRYMVLTDIFGPCGVGWKYEITKLWTEEASEGQKTAFATINFYYMKGEWSQPIPGIGGSMLVAKEKNGLHTSDEAYKMAVTDALSVALKMIGVAADVYLNNMDGSKYRAVAPKKEDVPESPLVKILAKMNAYDDLVKFQAYLDKQWTAVEFALKDFPKDLETATKAMTDQLSKLTAERL